MVVGSVSSRMRGIQSNSDFSASPNASLSIRYVVRKRSSVMESSQIDLLALIGECLNRGKEYRDLSLLGQMQ